MLIAMDLEDQVSAAGYHVVGMAVDLKSCQQIATDKKPHVAIMDMRLKNGDCGVDAARWLRETLDIGCVFISGTLDESIRERLAPYEPIAFLGKPILFSALEDHLGRLASQQVAGS